MFDTHCHLNFQAFDEIYKDVIIRAQEAGIKYMLVPSTDLPTSKKAVEIANDYSGVVAAVGIHPTKDLESIDLNKAFLKFEKYAKLQKVVAIGEIGLDYYRYRTAAALQR